MCNFCGPQVFAIKQFLAMNGTKFRGFLRAYISCKGVGVTLIKNQTTVQTFTGNVWVLI